MARYFERRRHLIYYEYIDRIVRGLAADAGSLLDVGSANAAYLDRFDWIPVRHALDLKKPYRSDSVQGIKADFLEFAPQQNYDFVTCFQVLEHIPDAARFARKLMATSDHVLISVPYKWPKGNKNHVHDPVDFKKVLDWFGREPDYRIIVREPLFSHPKGRRLIAYFNLSAEPMKDERSLRDNISRLWS